MLGAFAFAVVFLAEDGGNFDADEDGSVEDGEEEKGDVLSIIAAR